MKNLNRLRVFLIVVPSADAGAELILLKMFQIGEKRLQPSSKIISDKTRDG